MSRSYRKSNIIKFTGGWGRFMKKYSNRRLRQKKLTHNFHHKTYKRDTDSYDICDDVYYFGSFKEYYESSVRAWRRWQSYSWGKKQPFPDIQKEYHDWKKYHSK